MVKKEKFKIIEELKEKGAITQEQIDKTEKLVKKEPEEKKATIAEKIKKTIKKATQKIDRRKKENRQYIGGSTKGKKTIEENTPDQDAAELVSEEDKITETKGKNKPEKTCTLYQCPACNPEGEKNHNLNEGRMVAFKEPEETAKHLKEEHGMIIAPGDIIVNCRIDVSREYGEKILKGMETIKENIEKEETLEQERFKAALETPKDLEPHQIVSEAGAGTPDQVYKRTMLKIIAPPGTQQEDDVYAESIANRIIQITMIKTFPIHPEVINAIATLKRYM